MGAANSVEASNLSSDQQLKIYRQLRLEYAEGSKENLSPEDLQGRLLQRHNHLTNLYSNNGKTFKCPTVRFGRTEIDMPILTCGGMRMQETWNPKPDMTLELINAECQKNFKNIVQRSMELGINHFETARGYGTSEIQYGPILKEYPRQDYILQTKVAPQADPQAFRTMLEKSFKSLLLEGEGDYVDLLSLHGINRPEQLDWVVKPGGCMDVLKEYQSRGKIRFVGFSSHGMTPLIVQAIETGQFDYVNLHYQFIGSYTATGTGSKGGNLLALEAAQKQDMGVFIISPTDKGGALYEPPLTFTKLCQPLSPITFNNLWLWSSSVPIHTLVVGAARPSDMDDHLESALLYSKRHEVVAPIEAKLYKEVDDMFGPDFRDNWYVGLPDAYSNPEGLPITNLFWLWWIIKAWGFYNYALKRYPFLESGLKGWDDNKAAEENTKAFSWVPGIAYRPERGAQVRALLQDHPRREQVLQALTELHGWLSDGGFLKRGLPAPPGSNPIDTSGWAIAYDLQPDRPFPERG